MHTVPTTDGDFMKKTLLMILGGLLLTLSGLSEAHAVVCARGAWHAGCAGPHGAVVVPRRPVVVVPPRRAVVVAPRHCYWRHGVKVCH